MTTTNPDPALAELFLAFAGFISLCFGSHCIAFGWRYGGGYRWWHYALLFGGFGIAVVGGVMALSGLVPADGCRDDGPEYYTALDDLYQAFPRYDYLSIWSSNNYEDTHWRPLLSEEQQTIHNLRTKVFADKCYQKHYRAWLDYWQNGLNSAWKELQTKAEKKEMDSFQAASDKHQTMVEEYRMRKQSPIEK